MSDEAQAALQIDNAVISVQFVLGAAMSAMAWWIKRQDSKLSKVEADLANKVSLDIHNQTLEALRREIKESSNASVDMMARTHERIDKLLTFLAEKK